MEIAKRQVQGMNYQDEKLIIEENDYPWYKVDTGDEGGWHWRTDDVAAMRLALRTILYYRHILGRDNESFTLEEIMEDLGYVGGGRNTAALKRVSEQLDEICAEFMSNVPTVKGKKKRNYRFECSTINYEEVFNGERKHAVPLETVQIRDMKKIARNNRGKKFEDVLKVYLAIRSAMFTYYDDSGKFLGMGTLMAFKTITHKTGISQVTVSKIIQMLVEVKMLCVSSGASFFEHNEKKKMNCYTTVDNNELVLRVRNRKRPQKTEPKKKFIAARQGKGGDTMKAFAAETMKSAFS